MFAPAGFTVIVNLPDGTSKGIAVLDSLDHANDYASECNDVSYLWNYTVKQNYPDSAYTN